MKTTVLFGKLIKSGKWEQITDVTNDMEMVNQTFRTIKDTIFEKPEEQKYSDIIQYFSNGRAKIKNLTNRIEVFEKVEVNENPKVSMNERIAINVKKLLPKLQKQNKIANERAKVPFSERSKINLGKIVDKK